MHVHHRWAQSMTLIQVAIALAAIALLTRRKWLQWGVYLTAARQRCARRAGHESHLDSEDPDVNAARAVVVRARVDLVRRRRSCDARSAASLSSRRSRSRRRTASYARMRRRGRRAPADRASRSKSCGRKPSQCTYFHSRRAQHAARHSPGAPAEHAARAAETVVELAQHVVAPRAAGSPRRSGSSERPSQWFAPAIDERIEERRHEVDRSRRSASSQVPRVTSARGSGSTTISGTRTTSS